MAGQDKPNIFAELASALAVISAFETAAIAILKATGLADDLGAAYGVAVKDLAWVITCGAALLIALVFLWYFETLGGGAEAAGGGLRERFDRERARLAKYRAADDGYAQRLKAFLAWIDRVFDGDNPPSQHARILGEPAHVWTAAAYDRCLLLALIYPVVAIIFCWTIAGHVGPAESALELKEASGWLRAGITSSLVLFVVSSLKFIRTEGLLRISWGVACLYAIIGASASGDAVTVAFGGAFGAALTFTYAGVFAIATAFADTVALAFGGAFAQAFALIFAFAALVVFVVVVAGAVGLALDKSKKEGRQNVFLGVMSTLMFALSLLAARMLSTAEMAEYFNWDRVKPLFLFLVLFALVNAPFDWLSLGLTRLLFRYGIEKGGYWPYALAIVDVIVASLLITILALAMAWSNDLFNFLAEQGGGEQARVLPPSSFYLGMLEGEPAAPEFWWLYATLFSTMIPSVINLFIAGFSFVRTLPWARNFLLSNMREGETMPIVARLISSSILTAQVALAWPVAIFLQFILTYVVLWQIMPRLGLGILHLVETIGFV